MVSIDQLVSSSKSDVGRTRKENQDACGEFHNALGERLLVVADGMGGHAGGVTASRMCIEAVARVFESGAGGPGERLRRGFEEANAAIYSAASRDSSLYGMGTTGVALIFEPGGTVWLGWVGDSRAYRYRGGRLERLSEDHSVVFEWVRIGRLTPEEAEHHPQRNELSRAIGPDSEVEVDVRSFEVEPGDSYLLCSDGLCGFLEDARIAAVMGFEEPEEAVRQLIETVNVEYNSPDNVTVQIVAVPNEDGTLAAPSPHSPTAVMQREREERHTMSEDPSEADDAGYPRTRKILLVGLALLIVAALLAGLSWYAMTTRQADDAALSRAEAERESERQSELEQQARQQREAEQAAAAATAARIAAETAELEARTKREEAARAEAARLAELERKKAAEREAQIAAEIAATQAALAREQDAAAEAARILAEREAILAEQERRRQEALAREAEARRIEIAFNLAREVDEFVDEWTRALDEGDYTLYRQLGFRETEDEFRSLYGQEDADYQIAVFEKKQWVGGFVSLRVTETYDPPGSGPGLDARATERRLVLRPTSKGMRFAGDRD